MNITGLITLSRPLLFQREVLGKEFSAVIGDTEVTICFPEYPTEQYQKSNRICGISSPLVPPSFAQSWKRGNKPLNWGFPRNYPDGNSQVEILAFRIPINEDSSKMPSFDINDAISKWIERFIQYCLICTKQASYRTVFDEANFSRVEFVDNKRLVSNNYAASISVTLYPVNSFASYEQTQSAVSFASGTKELHLEYQMILSAYEAKNHGQNRRVILDACSALELCLVNKIKEFCSSKGISEDILLDKYRYLSDRFDLVKRINPSVVTDVSKKQIISLRNDVMHNKTLSPSNEETDALLVEVEKVLSNCYSEYY